MKTYDAIIIGAGAAGLMCAVEAGKRNRSVLLIDHSASIAKKLAISGGGRCNFTNRFISSENFISGDPRFCETAIEGFTPDDFISLLKKHRIKFHEKSLGQLFCDGGSAQIISMLAVECRRANIEFALNCDILEVSKNERFEVATSRENFAANSLVVATGGLSFPKTGASDLGHRIAKRFGIGVTPTKPALVPLLFGAGDRAIFAGLSGVSLPAVVSFGEQRFQDNILFTHKGLSGPAALQISSYWEKGAPISIDFLPEIDLLGLFTKNQSRKIELKNFLATLMPKSLAEALCRGFFESRRLTQYPPREFRRISEKLHSFELLPYGTEGFARAEVTLGGVDTAELSPKTMESKRVKGLYFVGEVVDVTGWLGGYNLQWAWSSGATAGRSIG